MDAAARAVRVLVVEDDEEIAQVLQRSLRLEGYEVKLAADGVRGLDEAHAFGPCGRFGVVRHRIAADTGGESG